ncbi:MAG: RloB family protein [Prevotellaceae bacterium]|jgi:hypothetical protein|nr:RloB family protein [Prevotellaceae bacterium]
MAQVTKLEKRFARKEQKRKINFREKRVYFLIVCEGTKTEPQYFASFETNFPPYTLDIETVGTGKNTLGVVEAAIQKRNSSSKKYDSVWAVFDRDSFLEQNFNNAIKKAAANGIKCAWSNEAFELWYILHFKYMDTGISRKDYRRHITSQFKKELPAFKYKKNDPEMYALLAKHGNQKQAVAWAKRLEKQYTGNDFAKHNPRTRVYALVEELNNPQNVPTGKNM